MSINLYVSGAEYGSGKSVIALALMEVLLSQGGRWGVFRPCFQDRPESDPLVNLLTQRYGLEPTPKSCFGCSQEEARQLIQEDRYAELLKRILESFKRLQRLCDRVLCVGTDFTSPTSALEFELNTDLANNLGCAILPVVRGRGRSPEEIIAATAAFLELLENRGCDVFATVINRIPPNELEAVRRLLPGLQAESPLYVVPEEPILDHPTMGDVLRSLGARLYWGDEDSLDRDVLGYKVAAMQLPNYLDHIEANDLVITPGDRADIILGSFQALASRAYPQIAGLLLTGNLDPPSPIRRLIDGLGKPPLAVLGVPDDTFTTALQVSRIEPALTIDNKRKAAAALGLVERHIDLGAVVRRLSDSRPPRMTPLMFELDLIERARRSSRRIVLPEGTEERILRAAEIIRLRDLAQICLLGNLDEVRDRIRTLGLRLGDVEILDPATSPLREQFAATYFMLRRHKKGVTEQTAFDLMADVSYFGTLMVHHGEADGMVSGSVHTTQHTIRPAFEIIKTHPGAALVSSVFFMCLPDRVLLYGDCAINTNPSAIQLAEIAISSANTAAAFGIEPRVAMLSYSTGDSGKGEDVDKVRKATEIVRERHPELLIEGPIQYDAAVDAGVAKTKLPGSRVAGRATVLIFPDLNTGNNTYKAVQRSAKVLAIGPVLQGLRKPVNDLSRGCTLADIVNTVAITAIQAQMDTLL